MPRTPFLLPRCVVLVDAVTTTVFNYVRRGLFERDKLTVATMLTLKILVNDGILAQEEVDYLVMSKVSNTGKIFPSGRIHGESNSMYFHAACPKISLADELAFHSSFLHYAGFHGSRKHGPARRMAAGNNLAKAQVS